MTWQDIVLAASGLILSVSLVPTIRGHDKPALSTGLVTTMVIAVVIFTMATMGLWLSAATNLLIFAAWGTITYQKLRQVRRARRSFIDELEEEILHGVDEEEEQLAGLR